MINGWAIGRDTKSWHDVEVFKPGRFTKENTNNFKGSCFKFLPFRAGRCLRPDMQLGLYGLEMAVAHLVQSFDWSLPDGLKPKEINGHERCVRAHCAQGSAPGGRAHGSPQLRPSNIDHRVITAFEPPLPSIRPISREENRGLFACVFLCFCSFVLFSSTSS
ncbi:hypothetical protein AMTR_s00001p00269960 [Amborella trichopoda]|uniref:Cytochrome P450 n=1 Tax=Amborella trichopoda TaxID=13333 RepID=W1NMQ6_AMBTC|nr:hypothetical protein AMTR_s00001p00269960 [Amborella trichopoda]